MKFWLILLVFLLHPACLTAEVFQYTDNEGKVHYVDGLHNVPEQYRPKAETIKAPAITKMKMKGGSTTPSKYASGRQKKVEFLMTSWCGYCKKMENYMKSKNIAYTKYDIEKNTKGRQIYQQLGGGGVPILRVGKTVVRGYNPVALDQALR